MAISTEERLENALASAMSLARQLTDGKAKAITVEFQASGELPFRVVVPDEPLPLVGTARVDPQPEVGE